MSYKSTLITNNEILQHVLDTVSGIQRADFEPMYFFLDADIYAAEKGMTWAEWCDSEYNTDGYTYSPDGAVGFGLDDDDNISSMVVEMNTDRFVSASDAINPRYDYYTQILV